MGKREILSQLAHDVVVYKQVPSDQGTTVFCKDITLEQPSCKVDETARLFSESERSSSVEATSTDKTTINSQNKRKELTLVSAMPPKE